MTSAPRAIVFDLDGTLVDSYADVSACLAEAFVDSGLPRPAALTRDWLGPPLDTLIARLAPDTPPERRARIRSAFVERYDESDFPDTHLYPGVLNLLATLKELEIPAYIATAKRARPTARILAKYGIERAVAGVAAGDPGPTGPRDKVAIVQTLERELSPFDARVWIVGDMPSDIEAGHRFGLTTVAALWGYSNPSTLLSARPTWFVESASELVHFVRQMWTKSRP